MSAGCRMQLYRPKRDLRDKDTEKLPPGPLEMNQEPAGLYPEQQGPSKVAHDMWVAVKTMVPCVP